MSWILWLIVGFVLLDAVVEGYLSWLNTSYMGRPVPTVLSGIYDEEKYRTQQNYMRDHKRLSRVSSAVALVVTLVVLLCGLLGWLDGLTARLVSSPGLQLVLFIAVITVVSTLIDLPFDYYDTFVIEERYGFNKSTRLTFWLDMVKSLVVSLVLSGALLWVIELLYEWLGTDFWLVASAVVVSVLVFISLFYSNLIVPLFNKQRPLEEGELRDAIEQTARRAGFAMKNIYVIDGSKRSTHANAYFTGFGAKKRIVLYDTLIEQLTTDEIVAVLCHEMGHYRHHDTLKLLVAQVLKVVAMLFVFSLLDGNRELSEALGGTRESFALSLSAFGLLFSPIGLLIGPLENYFSRRYEYRADRFASSLGFSEALISGLKKLSANSLVNLTPHPLVVKMTYSHPTLEQRVLALMRNKC